jgi:hypothetical protein
MKGLVLSTCLACWLFTQHPSIAQKKTQDVIRLQNGWVLKGKLQNEGDNIRLSTADGQEFVFPANELIEQATEPFNTLPPVKQKGFNHYTELGALATQNNSDANVNTSAFSFQTVNGYRFHPLLFIGAGVGVDLYATETYIPLFASLRGDLLKNGGIVPFYFFDLGYGVNITESEPSDLENRGGGLMATGIGIKARFQNQTAFLLSIGYRQQNSTLEMNGMATDNTYRRLALRAGFAF